MARPLSPEPKFFLNPDKIDKGYEHYRSLHFKEDSMATIFGEKSTSYMGSLEAALAMRKMIPQVKILIMLRNPIDRAISNYFFSKKNGFETRSLREVFIEGKELNADISNVSVNPFLYLERGRYCNYLTNYLDVFGEENVKLLIQEDVIADPMVCFRDLFEWLEVETKHDSESMYAIVNSARKTDIIEEAVLDKLKVYYNEWNVRLANQYNLDLKKWND